ncbi:MAG TPA: glycosyltransferase family 2 protein [Flavobacteriaceae bacterium]|nr:glycosyltransferase family 2 protein [Flavobacteriaceae bacterium]
MNQTEKGQELTSKYDNIRVVNSYDKGLPQSRNLAIKNAKEDICLIADDDVKYLPDFEKAILDAFKSNKADIITYKMKDDKGRDFKFYPNIKQHNLKSIKSVNSVVISFNRNKLIEKNIFFNENFGLGSTFEIANEYVFLRNALEAKANIIFEPKYILTHEYISTGRKQGNDKVIFGRSALFYKYHNKLAYLKLLHYLYLIYKTNFITLKEVPKKIKIGLKGIAKYKELLKTGLEKNKR